MVVLILAGIGALVLVPLGLEYRDLRARGGFGRLAALATTGLVFPALGAGIALALPLAARPTLQWAATVAATLLLYSLAARAIAARAASAATAPSRRI